MKITIVQTEIEEAIHQYLNEMVRLPEGKKIQLDILATRGSNGITAEINFVDAEESAKEEEPVVQVQPEEQPASPMIQSEIAQAKQEETEVPKQSMFGGIKKQDPEEHIQELAKKKSFFSNVTI